MSGHPQATSIRPDSTPPTTQRDPGDRTHTGGVEKSDPVMFRLRRVADENWQIQAFCQGAKIEHIITFGDEEAAKQWLADESPTWAQGMRRTK
jgi:hypothetical protein